MAQSAALEQLGQRDIFEREAIATRRRLAKVLENRGRADARDARKHRQGDDVVEFHGASFVNCRDGSRTPA